MGDEGGDGPQWVDRTKRPKPAPLETEAQEVSRASGLTFSTGTFGKSRRFPKEGQKMTGPGSQSPSRELYYSRNALFKTSLEEPPATSLGIGPRPGMEKSGPSSVGPGSYNIVHSAAGPRSPLDGPEFCATTIKVKLPSSLVGHAMPSPGPHARYEVRGDLNRHLPTYSKHKPLLGHGGARLLTDKEDKDPGPGAYQTQTYNSTSINASCPNLLGGGQGCMEASGGTKRCLKSTFGMSQRFPKDKVPNSSPQGDRYYAHSKILDKEDYLNGVRSCSFGASGKTDMAKLHSNSDVSPVTYRTEQLSTIKAYSPLDGGTNRCPSPVAVFSKGASSAKHSTKSRTPHMLKGAGGSLSTGALNAAAASLDA